MNAYFRLNELEKSKILFDLRRYFDNNEEVIFSYLYGEFFFSDFFKKIDIGIYLNDNIDTEKTKDKVLDKIYTQLSKLVEIPIELVIINNIKLDHKIEIIKSTLLTCRDDDFRERFIRSILKE